MSFVTKRLHAEVAELADARDSKSRGAAPHVGSIPTFGTNDETPSSIVDRGFRRIQAPSCSTDLCGHL